MNISYEKIYSEMINQINEQLLVNLQVEKLDEILALDPKQKEYIRVLIQRHLNDMIYNRLYLSPTDRKKYTDAIFNLLSESQQQTYLNFQNSDDFKFYFTNY